MDNYRIWHKYSLGSGINIHYNSKVSWPSRLFRHYEIIKATRHCGTAVSFRVARARAISPPKLGIAFRSPNMSQNHACTYATQAHAHTGVVSPKPRAIQWRTSEIMIATRNPRSCMHSNMIGARAAKQIMR